MSSAQLATGFDTSGPPREAAESAVIALKALSHVGRVHILCLLLDGPMNVGGLAKALHEPQARVSQQLMRLWADAFVRVERRGRHMSYELADVRIIPLIKAILKGFCAELAQ